MPLSISDILGQKKIKKLFREPIQYSTLVKHYKNLDKEKVELISESETSFLDILINARSPDLWKPKTSSTSESPSDIKGPIYNALVQKIIIGLMATDRISLRDISTRILQLGTNFISDETLTQICSDYPEHFTILKTENGPVVRNAQSGDTRIVREKHTPSSSTSPDESHVRTVLKKLYQTRPEVIAALTQAATFKDILKAYNFWKERVNDESCVHWLLTLARVNELENFTAYRDHLKSLILSRVMTFLRPCSRSVLQVCENLCIDRPKFITNDEVQDLIISFPKELYLHVSTKSLRPHQQRAGLTAVGKEIADDPESREEFWNTASSVNRTAVVNQAQPQSEMTDFILCTRLESRIKPVLSIKIGLDFLSSVHKVVITSTRMRLLVEKYGCFMSYLVEYAKATKPKLPTNEFVHHLYNLIKPDVMWALNHHCDGKSVVEIVHERTPRGLLDDAFISDAMRFYSSKADTGEIVVDDDEEENDKSPHIESDPFADLESERVLHLITKQPRFLNVRDVFLTLPDVSVSLLANNSMSFFEWLISLSKRLMPHDAPIFEAHLQGLLQEEVARLHSTQHCQMTIHHVHSLLCEDHSMLLSPNFLNWCLEQPNSSFCVYQSWIYLKHAIRRKPSSELATAGDTEPPQRRKAGYDMEKLLLSIRECQNLADLLKVIRDVPLEQVGQIMQKNSYWYDFFESNLPDRKDRQILSSLLAEEAKSCLEGEILKIGQLVSRIAKGRVNFVSTDALEYVLRQYRDTFALAGKGGEDLFVGTTRQMSGDEVKCADGREETLMRQVLLYFPSTGSCDIFTILDAINKEDSFLFKGDEALDLDYLRCFFLVFPMLFYLRGDVVVLTCLALNTKGRYKSALFPTSTTGFNSDDAKSIHRGRKRSSSHRRRRHDSGKWKRRKKSASRDSSSSNESPKRVANISTEVIVVSESSEEEKDGALPGFCDEQETNLVVDEKSNPGDLLKETIDGLPISLVIDVTASLLLKNGGTSEVSRLLRELLITTVGTEEGQQIQASENLFFLFKRKILEGLRQHESKFILVNKTTDPDLVSEVRMAEEGEISAEPRNDRKDDPQQDRPQVEEVTSTSISPNHPSEVTSPPESPPNALSDRNAITDDGDVIRLPANSYIVAEPNNTECVRKDKNAQTREQGPSGVTGDEIHKAQENNVAVNKPETLIPDSGPDASTAKETGDVMKSPVRPIMPIYSSSPASTAYMKRRPVHTDPKKYRKMSREGQFMDFFRSFLNVNAGSCATELLIADAHRRFQNERFARSRLAFEAYIYDFAVCNSDAFLLSGTGCEKGVSKISYRRASPKMSPLSDHPDNLSFLQLIPDVCTSSLAFLSAKPQKRDYVDGVCKAIGEVFQCRLEGFHPSEIPATLRCLVLVSAIRNLKLFCFAVGDPVLYIRHHKQPDPAISSGPPGEHHDQIATILSSANVREAILLMAKLLETSRALSRTPLRDLWESEAPPALAKVFGSGLSFMLSLRKYSFLFPTNEEGVVTVNEIEMDRIRHGRV